MQYLPKSSNSKSGISAIRRFNRFYTRRIGALQPQYLGSPYSLPQARVLPLAGGSVASFGSWGSMKAGSMAAGT